MSDDKAKKVKVEDKAKTAAKDGKLDDEEDEDLDAIFGDEDDSVRLSKTKLDVSKSQLDAAIGDDDGDEELEDEDA